jgi:hypothetical protein
LRQQRRVAAARSEPASNEEEEEISKQWLCEITNLGDQMTSHRQKQSEKTALRRKKKKRLQLQATTAAANVQLSRDQTIKVESFLSPLF